MAEGPGSKVTPGGIFGTWDLGHVQNLRELACGTSTMLSKEQRLESWRSHVVFGCNVGSDQESVQRLAQRQSMQTREIMVCAAFAVPERRNLLSRKDSCWSGGQWIPTIEWNLRCRD